MIKSRGASGTASVTFTLDPSVGARNAVVCGEWNDWSPDAHLMEGDGNGGFTLTLELEPGRAYRFRYLLDSERWENDWAADAYVPNEFGADDSLVDLTALAEDLPPAAGSNGSTRAKAAPRKAVGTKKATPAKKAAAAKKAAGVKKAAPAKNAGKRPGAPPTPPA